MFANLISALFPALAGAGAAGAGAAGAGQVYSGPIGPAATGAPMNAEYTGGAGGGPNLSSLIGALGLNSLDQYTPEGQQKKHMERASQYKGFVPDWN